MKKTAFCCLLALQVAAGWLGVSSATAATSVPVIMASMGCWNVEINLRYSFTTMRFFNARHQLVYKERIEGMRLDLSYYCSARRRAIRIFDQALVQLQPNCPPPQVAKLLLANRSICQGYAPRPGAESRPVANLAEQ